MMRLEHDKEADAIYVTLRQGKRHHTTEIDESRLVDYDEQDRPVGIELLGVSDGVDVEDLPEADRLAQLLKKHNIPVYA